MDNERLEIFGQEHHDGESGDVELLCKDRFISFRVNRIQSPEPRAKSPSRKSDNGTASAMRVGEMNRGGADCQLQRGKQPRRHGAIGGGRVQGGGGPWWCLRAVLHCSRATFQYRR
jgi:hypothetical protein